MIEKPDTFRALIARLGGVSAFSSKTTIGEFAAKKMRDRNSIAVRHWPEVIDAARSDGLILTTDDLVNMKLLIAVSADDFMPASPSTPERAAS